MRNSMIPLALLLAACAGSPAYRPPPVAVPAEFRERLSFPADSAASPDAVPPAAAAEPAPKGAGEATAPGEAWRALGDRSGLGGERDTAQHAGDLFPLLACALQAAV